MSNLLWKYGMEKKPGLGAGTLGSMENFLPVRDVVRHINVNLSRL